MATLKMRFISPGDFSSGIIEFFEGGSQWSHIEFILEDGSYLGARDNGGIQIRPVDYVKSPAREKRYGIPVTDEMYNNIINFAKSKIDTSYNMEDIFGIALHRDWNDPKKYICSEFVAACCAQAGLPMLNV